MPSLSRVQSLPNRDVDRRPKFVPSPSNSGLSETLSIQAAVIKELLLHHYLNPRSESVMKCRRSNPLAAPSFRQSEFHDSAAEGERALGGALQPQLQLRKLARRDYSAFPADR